MTAPVHRWPALQWAADRSPACRCAMDPVRGLPIPDPRIRWRTTMSIPCKFERSILGHEEHEIIMRSRHPWSSATLGLGELKELRQRLRAMRDKETHVGTRQTPRGARAKGAPRGQGFPGTRRTSPATQTGVRRRVKRVNREVDRMQKLEARNAHIDAARRALAMHRAAQFPPRPPTGDTSGQGMPALPSRRRRTRVPPAKIGSVSQATRKAQAIRDARNRSAP